MKAVRRSAEETLTDLRVININPEVYQEFINPLDATLVNTKHYEKQ
ncbi:TPA: hypothetical protein KEV90_002717 [Proteus mirabilis]|nr:hypothetical protein [Proteus mirabilis]